MTPYYQSVCDYLGCDHGPEQVAEETLDRIVWGGTDVDEAFAQKNANPGSKLKIFAKVPMSFGDFGEYIENQ